MKNTIHIKVILPVKVVAADNTPSESNTSVKNESNITIVNFGIEDVRSANKNQVKSYEINLKDAAGAEIHQLNGKVQVMMKAPFKPAVGYTLKVYCVDGDKFVPCTSELKGDDVVNYVLFIGLVLISMAGLAVIAKKIELNKSYICFENYYYPAKIMLRGFL